MAKLCLAAAAFVAVCTVIFLPMLGSQGLIWVGILTPIFAVVEFGVMKLLGKLNLENSDASRRRVTAMGVTFGLVLTAVAGRLGMAAVFAAAAAWGVVLLSFVILLWVITRKQIQRWRSAPAK